MNVRRSNASNVNNAGQTLEIEGAIMQQPLTSCSHWSRCAIFRHFYSRESTCRGKPLPCWLKFFFYSTTRRGDPPSCIHTSSPLEPCRYAMFVSVSEPWILATQTAQDLCLVCTATILWLGWICSVLVWRQDKLNSAQGRLPLRAAELQHCPCPLFDNALLCIDIRLGVQGAQRMQPGIRAKIKRYANCFFWPLSNWQWWSFLSHCRCKQHSTEIPSSRISALFGEDRITLHHIQMLYLTWHGFCSIHRHDCLCSIRSLA